MNIIIGTSRIPDFQDSTATCETFESYKHQTSCRKHLFQDLKSVCTKLLHIERRFTRWNSEDHSAEFSDFQDWKCYLRNVRLLQASNYDTFIAGTCQDTKRTDRECTGVLNFRVSLEIRVTERSRIWNSTRVCKYALDLDYARPIVPDETDETFCVSLLIVLFIAVITSDGEAAQAAGITARISAQSSYLEDRSRRIARPILTPRWLCNVRERRTVLFTGARSCNRIP